MLATIRLTQEELSTILSNYCAQLNLEYVEHGPDERGDILMRVVISPPRPVPVPAPAPDPIPIPTPPELRAPSPPPALNEPPLRLDQLMGTHEFDPPTFATTAVDPEFVAKLRAADAARKAGA